MLLWSVKAGVGQIVGVMCNRENWLLCHCLGAVVPCGGVPLKLTLLSTLGACFFDRT